MSFSFQSNNGSLWPLDGTVGVTVLEGSSGLWSTSADLTVEQRVGTDGAVPANVRFPPRPVDLQLLIENPDHTVNVLPLWATLLSAFKAGGLIRSTVPTLPARTRVLRQLTYQSVTPRFGHELTEVDSEVMAVSMLAMDPWWYANARAVSLLFGSSSTPWNSPNPWSPALPWNGGASTSITVEGDASASPFVDLYGPTSDVNVSISTPSLSKRYGWRTQFALTAGQRLTIDHRWGSRGPRLGGSASVNWGLLTAASRLFALPVGQSTLVAGIVGSSAATQAVMYWEPRWLTP